MGGSGETHLYHLSPLRDAAPDPIDGPHRRTPLTQTANIQTGYAFPLSQRNFRWTNWNGESRC